MFSLIDIMNGEYYGLVWMQAVSKVVVWAVVIFSCVSASGGDTQTHMVGWELSETTIL